MRLTKCLLLTLTCSMWLTLPIVQTHASILSPKMPSTINFQSLNGIAVPSTETDWSFEMSRLDMAIGSDHMNGLRARNTDIYLLQYQLMHTALATDTTELGQLASFASANGYDVESAFLHYYDNTNVTYTSGATATIPGYGGGSASSLQQARVKNNIWGSERYVYNPKSDLFRKFKGDYFRGKMTSGDKPDGIMIDECGPINTYIPNSTSGGHIREYTNQTRDQIAATYNSDMTAAFGVINGIMGTDSPYGDRILLPNVGEYVPDLMDLGLNGADGLLTEFYIQIVAPRIPYAYDAAKQLADKGKIMIFSQGVYSPETSSIGNYNSATDRHQMFSLTNYWIARQGRYTFYQQMTSDALQSLSQFWCKAREYNVGTPVDALYAVWKTGTDSAGQNFTIYKREYTNALMLCRPQPGWTYKDYNTRSQLFDLGGTYKLLHWDGTLGPNITQIGLAMGEAVTLIKNSPTPPPPSDTTPPAISGVNVTGITTSGANITWATNEAATGVVDYGTSTSYGSTIGAAISGTSQNVALSSLTASTTYHYRITATDTAGNKTVSPDYTFTTVSPSSSPAISVTISADKASAKSGDTITYTVDYKNTGTGSATSVTVNADVDPNVNFTSASNGGSFDSTTRVVRWSVGTLAAGSSSTVTYSVTVK